MAMASHVNEWTLLSDHVGDFKAESPHVSCFVAALRDAGFCLGRDLKTGLRVSAQHDLASWPGTFVYLVLLEQIGKTLRPKGGRDLPPKAGKKLSDEHPLERALRQFAAGNVTLTQRKALYALRCALAHEYGLFNASKSPDYNRHFTLTDSGPMFLRPKVKWNGSYSNPNLGSATTVNVIKVADMAEEVVRSVRAHSNQMTLRSRVSLKELQMRFSLTMSS